MEKTTESAKNVRILSGAFALFAALIIAALASGGAALADEPAAQKSAGTSPNGIVALTTSATPDVSDLPILDGLLEASNQLYSALFAGETTITLRVKSDSYLDEAEILEIADRAIDYVEGPAGGDYLRWRSDFTSEAHPDVEPNVTDVTYKFRYFTTDEQEAKVDQKVSQIINDLGLTKLDEHDCIVAIYRYITSSVSYDYANLNNDSYTLKYTAYAALFNGKAVCQGYASLFYRLAKECGLETRIITGKADTGEEHGWNIVSIDGAFYNVDCTWDAGKTSGAYRYLLKCDASFSDHIRDAKFTTKKFNEYYPMSYHDYVIRPDFSSSKTYKSGKYSYKVSDQGSALITAYSGNEKSITVPAKLGGHPVYALDARVFDENCTATTITLSEGIKGWFCNGDSTFDRCPNLTTLNLPSTVGYCDGGDYDVPAHNDRIYDCKKLKKITVAKSNPYLTVKNNVLFTKDMKTLIYYPGGATATSYKIPNGVAFVDDCSFRNQRYIKSVTLPKSVKYIGAFSFLDAKKLASVNIPGDCEVISQHAFNGTAVTSISIPASVEIIEGAALASPKLKKITVAAGNPYFYVQKGVLFSKHTYDDFEMITLVAYPAKRAGSSYTIPKGVTLIDHSAFEYASKLKTVKFPNTLEVIYGEAFAYSPSLKSLILPDSLTDIRDLMCIDCFALKSVYVPSSVKEVGDGLFDRIDGLIVFGKKGSAMQAKAKAEGYKFRAVGNAKPGEISQTVKLSKTKYTVARGSKPFKLKAKTNGDGTLKYKSSNTKVATVNSKGKVTIRGTGKATITVYAAATSMCKKSAAKKVTIRVK